MIVQLSESETKGSFSIEENSERLGEMTFSKAGSDRIIIDHTDVADNWKGFGIGELMVREAVKLVSDDASDYDDDL